MPMPEPKYLDVEEEIAEEKAKDEERSRDFIRMELSNTPAAWLTRFCETAAGDIVRSAVTTVNPKHLKFSSLKNRNTTWPGELRSRCFLAIISEHKTTQRKICRCYFKMPKPCN